MICDCEHGRQIGKLERAMSIQAEGIDKLTTDRDEWEESTIMDLLTITGHILTSKAKTVL